MILSNDRKFSTSNFEYSIATSACRLRKRPWTSQMCQPQSFTGLGKHGLKTKKIANQFVKIPRKKPVAGRKIARPRSPRLLKAISCKMPQKKPMAAPQCSMKRNSLSPNFWKKVFSNSLFSVSTFTYMPSLSRPSSRQSMSMNFPHSSGALSWIFSNADCVMFSLACVGNIPFTLGKCRLPTVSRAPWITSRTCGLTLATSSFGLTRVRYSRGPSRFGLAQA
mmetsp:Transcript_55658/g.156731  ORF Transcript_55658/g.156731 Transcript_55658/m.156731 type:complete len:222 (+) Transcript_55658:602-1267(+)